jgi:hypothetical protein
MAGILKEEKISFPNIPAHFSRKLMLLSIIINANLKEILSKGYWEACMRVVDRRIM